MEVLELGMFTTISPGPDMHALPPPPLPPELLELLEDDVPLEPEDVPLEPLSDPEEPLDPLSEPEDVPLDPLEALAELAPLELPVAAPEVEVLAAAVAKLTVAAGASSTL
jgi:hypothetical protein